MGSGSSVAGQAPVRLNVAAVSNVVHLTKDELLELMKQTRDFAQQSQPTDCVDRENFLAACEIVGVHESDVEIVDKIFTLFDATGNDLVGYRKFVASFAMLIRGTMADKLQFAFQLYDIDMKRTINEQHMNVLLGAVSDCLDFFGDMKLPSRRIAILVENIFQESDKNADGEIDLAEGFLPLTSHPIVNDYMDKARNHAAVGMKKMGL
jgi:Kv channel-interacting protein